MGGAQDPNADSAELEALFESVAAQTATATVAAQPKAPAMTAVAGSGNEIADSDELQALFDSVASNTNGMAANGTAAIAAAAGSEEWQGQDRAFNAIGQLVRQLHDALLGLGYDKLIEKTMSALPDAKDRLAYVANLTEQAACRVLNATDIAMPLQEQLDGSAKSLGGRWDQVFAGKMNVQDFKQLATETKDFLNVGMPEKISATNAQLMEIMMAQDFQDLTGQVIKKIVALAQEMEGQMMQVLIDIMPDVRKTEEVNSLLNGPVINTDGRSDVVANQAQVDDLLGSLGF